MAPQSFAVILDKYQKHSKHTFLLYIFYITLYITLRIVAFLSQSRSMKIFEQTQFAVNLKLQSLSKLLWKYNFALFLRYLRNLLFWWTDQVIWKDCGQNTVQQNILNEVYFPTFIAVMKTTISIIYSRYNFSL